jgi:Flp pilus assembly secretin CpaC
MKKQLVAGLLGVAALVQMNSASSARDALRVQVDESQTMTLPGTPGAIILGNPSIADVSVQGSKLFIHGRGFGQTNLTILDLQGNAIADFDLMVSHTQISSIAVYRGTARQSYSCAPYCEGEVQVGDSEEHFKQIIGQVSSKIQIATGSKTAEASAPPAPQ